MQTGSENNKKSTSIDSVILQERNRQARVSLNLSRWMLGMSTVISLIGAALLITGKIPEGTATASSGLFSVGYSFQLAKDANDRLERITVELNDEDED
jgi:hypothetical protein